MTDIALHLSNHGIRPSIQRMAIMGYLMQHATHPTVDTIYNDLLPGIPTLSRTTVYNTLELFRERGAVKVLTIDSKNLHYDGNIDAHAHFRCRGCGKIFDIKLPEEVNNIVNTLPHMTVEQTEIYYNGICDECEQKAKKMN